MSLAGAAVSDHLYSSGPSWEHSVHPQLVGWCLNFQNNVLRRVWRRAAVRFVSSCQHLSEQFEVCAECRVCCSFQQAQENGSTPVAALELCWQKPLPGWRSHGFNLAILFQGWGFFFQDTASLFQRFFIEDGVAVWNEPVPRQLTRRDLYCSLQVACHHFLPQWVFYYGFTKREKKGSLVFFQILDEDTSTSVHLKKRIWDEMNSLPSLPNT